MIAGRIPVVHMLDGTGLNSRTSPVLVLDFQDHRRLGQSGHADLCPTSGLVGCQTSRLGLLRDLGSLARSSEAVDFRGEETTRLKNRPLLWDVASQLLDPLPIPRAVESADFGWCRQFPGTIDTLVPGFNIIMGGAKQGSQLLGGHAHIAHIL